MSKIIPLFLVISIILFQWFIGNNVFGNEQKFINTVIKNTPTSPDFRMVFQRPSYLLDINNTTSAVYFCDTQKDECKVNLKLLKPENSKDLSSTLDCSIETTFESDQLKRCNPNTVIFPEGIHPVKIKVESKKHPEYFSEFHFIIVNGEIEESLLNSEIEKITDIIYPNNVVENLSDTGKGLYSGEAMIQDIISNEVRIIPLSQPSILLDEGVEKEVTLAKPLSSILTPSQEQGSSSTVTIPDFQYIFQRPSYILDTHSEEGEAYFCDKEKDECKINFKLLDIVGKDISTKLECEITLGFISSEYKKCNPNTIIFPEGEHKVVFKIFEKNNKTNFKEKTIWIYNKSIAAEEKLRQEVNETVAQPLSSSFTPSQEQGSSSIVKHYLPQTKIRVQGKIGKTKKVGISKMTCYTYNECSINFTSGKIYKSQRQGIHFKWDFGNGQKYYDYNPKSIKFSPGNYKVRLIVSDDYGNKKSEVYKVTVIKLYTKTQIKRINSSIEVFSQGPMEAELIKNLKLYSPEYYNIFSGYKKHLESIVTSLNTKLIKSDNTQIQPAQIQSDNIHKDTSTEKNLAKNIKLRVVYQKKNLKIHGTTSVTSRVEIQIGKQKFETYSDEKGNYSLKVNDLQKGNYTIVATAFNKQGKVIAQKSSAKKEFTQQYITQLKSYQKKSPQSTTQKPKSTLEKSLAKNISLRVSLQKKNLKIYGTTTARSKVIFNIGNQTFSTYSDALGKYELKTNAIKVGTYKILASVYNKGMLVAKKSSSAKTFSLQYITKMRSYKLNKGLQNRLRKAGTKKFTLEKKEYKNSNTLLETGFNIKIFVINMLIAILSIILLLSVLIRRKLI